MSQSRIGVLSPVRRWYADRKAERQALTEYKATLRALTRLHRHRDSGAAAAARPRSTIR